MARPLRLVALISGGGTTVVNLLARIDRGDLDAQVDLVVSSRARAPGVERARSRGVEVAVVPSRRFRRNGAPDWAAMSAALDEVILPREPDLVVFAGFLCFYRLPEALRERAMNIHPALLPAFGGRGWWGMRVHEAVVAAGVKVTGCTVHFVTGEYDRGPIILQRTCPVFDTDTAQDVAHRVFREECIAYPEAIRLFHQGRLRVDGGIVRIAPPASSATKD